jgi:hypothetical protein
MELDSNQKGTKEPIEIIVSRRVISSSSSFWRVQRNMSFGALREKSNKKENYEIFSLFFPHFSIPVTRQN